MALSKKITICDCFIPMAAVLIVGLIPYAVEPKTLEADVEALRSIKLSVDPNSITSNSFLNSWNFASDPCEMAGSHFLGVLCTVPEDNSSSRISAIDLEGDGIEGFLNPAVGNLTELAVINLSRNKFRGPIPSSITNLLKLTRIQLSNNFFSGSIPTSISRLRKLEEVDLSRNRLSGSILASITALRSLTRLCLSENTLSGRIPDLTGLWQLNLLDLSSNQFYGDLPRVPTNLRTLILSHNSLSGHISSVTKLRHLKVLDLSDNRLSGPITTEVLLLPEVTHINISINHFTAFEVEKDQGTELRLLDVHDNNLHGHLPQSIITYLNLDNMNLGHNQFSGHIPDGYGQKLGRPWRSLYLDYNYLEGNLPPGFNRTSAKARGSLTHNCLNCPGDIHWCHGGQRPASECGR